MCRAIAYTPPGPSLPTSPLPICTVPCRPAVLPTVPAGWIASRPTGSPWWPWTPWAMPTAGLPRYRPRRWTWCRRTTWTTWPWRRWKTPAWCSPGPLLWMQTGTWPATGCILPTKPNRLNFQPTSWASNATACCRPPTIGCGCSPMTATATRPVARRWSATRCCPIRPTFRHSLTADTWSLPGRRSNRRPI